MAFQEVTHIHRVRGLGERRVRRLLDKFGSFEALRQASLEQIAGTAGIGPTLARRIYQLLHASN